MSGENGLKRGFEKVDEVKSLNKIKAKNSSLKELDDEIDTEELIFEDDWNGTQDDENYTDGFISDEDEDDYPLVEFDEYDEHDEDFRRGGYSDDIYKARAGAAVRNEKFEQEYVVEKVGLTNVGTPEELALKLEAVGYQCLPFNAAQVALLLNSPTESVRSILLEGPSGCGKSFMAKCLAKITGAELMCLTCYPGMDLQHLIEYPSTLAMANAMTGRAAGEKEELMNLGIISRAFLKSQEKPVIFLIDELDKVEVGIDTFFLGPIQDARIWLESRDPIEANTDNLLLIFTKNYERHLNDALLRRLHPVAMTYLNSDLEKAVLKPHCDERLIENLVGIADTMRYGDGSYRFERPPAPEELLKVARYVRQMLEWDIVDFSFVGRNVWYLLAKGESDRFVLELMLRYHPKYHDSLRPNGRLLTLDEVYGKLGRIVLRNIVDDPEDEAREHAYKPERVSLVNVGTPDQLIERLAEVKYQCLPFLATQVCLILNTPTERVRALLLEGPTGCGKSFLAKSLAKICGAEFMCLSCYAGMNTQHLIEVPSIMGIANAMAGRKFTAKEEMVNLGILSRAFLKSHNQPVVLLIDEIDKVDTAIDTFFLGPIQDATIFPESRPPIDANTDNLLLIFTKNFIRNLNDALLRRIHPVQFTYLNADLEKKILKDHCDPQLISNLIGVVDRMRYSGGTYGFDRPPAPEEMLQIGLYINNMLEWNITDFCEIGRNVWSIISKSDHDRAVLEHMMRFHPDFLDPLTPDGRAMTLDQVYAKLGRTLLKDIVTDKEAKKRDLAWEKMEYDY
ncbi:MAG: AAA family ATPase [Bdellovibrionota bacterium]|jgi:MoxR-like ATPase